MPTSSQSRARLYQWLSLILLSCGAVLGAVVGLQLLAETVHGYAANQVDQLLIAGAPTIGIPLPTATATATPTPRPSSTPLPTATATATPTPTPTPLPPIRLQIPAIGLNSRVKTLDAQITRQSETLETWNWPDPGFVVAHYAFSGRPTEQKNIVLAGHNNWKGEVFRYLANLKPGDTIRLSTADNDYEYVVTETVIIPYRRNPTEGAAKLWEYMGPQPGERLTLVSCYPYLTNADRIVVIAEPLATDR